MERVPAGRPHYLSFPRRLQLDSSHDVRRVRFWGKLDQFCVVNAAHADGAVLVDELVLIILRFQIEIQRHIMKIIELFRQEELRNELPRSISGLMIDNTHLEGH